MLDTSKTDHPTTAMLASADATTGMFDLLTRTTERRLERARQGAGTRSGEWHDDVQALAGGIRGVNGPLGLMLAFQGWAIDAAQRQVLFLDVLRKRGDQFLEHEAAGAPPVLIYDYELVLDGATLPRPCNYFLLRILPPAGIEIDVAKRPYVIIDPRAGHGAGIGGFKPDSQVGVALKSGQPTYFVAFRPMPEPGQTIAVVTDAEAAFLRLIRELHPESPKPIVIGNCQGGWAAAILAATHPELTGPIVLSGAPMAYWSGTVGQDPMRYAGGLTGGAMPSALMADLGGGLFDGAALVKNFEGLNPGRTQFRKYFDLYTNIDTGEARFLEFERWWGGLHLMNGEEMQWIVENLFVGNRLAANEAMLEPGRPIDLRSIKAPVIVFASRGDNITPPAQALNWIVDTYADESEIEIRGQRIVYVVHEDVGHLGIFVSSKVATREHTEIASILETIEALPPGLYELIIEDVIGVGEAKRFSVSFARRTTAEIAALDDARADERAFAAVARASEMLTELYETTARPVIRAMITRPVADAGRATHPLRLQRSAFASRNPFMSWVSQAADQVKAERRPADPENPFVIAERAWADVVEASYDRVRDWRELMTETMFFSAWANPFAAWYGAPRVQQRTRAPVESLRDLPEVVSALDHIETGGYPEALIRMLVLIAATRATGVRRSRLERSFSVLTTREPFASMEVAARARLIHEQSLIARFAPVQAFTSLPALIPTAGNRRKALATVAYVVGDVTEMDTATQEYFDDLRSLLSLD